MCFSATASFSAAGVLAVTGGFAMKESVAKKSHFLLALTPSLFALHQFIEGFVWIGINSNNSRLTQAASTTFLFFALFFWIVWIPTVAHSLESRKKAKKFFSILITIGIIFGLYLWLPVMMSNVSIANTSWLLPFHHFGAFFHTNTTTKSCGNNLCYIWISNGSDPFQFIKSAIYVSLGCLYLTCNDSAFRKFWFLVMASGFLAQVTMSRAWISVWCYFSAIASMYIVYLLKKLKAQQPNYSDLPTTSES